MNEFKKYLGSNSVKLAIAGVVGLNIIYKGLYRVEPGFLSIKFNIFSGIGGTTYKEGYHILFPYVERAIVYDCRMKNHVHKCICGTKDLQIVTLKTRIICRPKVDKLRDLYRLLGNDYDERALQSIVHEICGIAVSQFNASQIISQRDTISSLIKHRIMDKSREFFIDVDDVALIDIIFSREFSEAIEQKQVAQQEAERTKILVEQALEEKKSTIIRALGETEAVRKFGEANQTSSAFLVLRKLETAQKISSILMNSSNKVLLDSNSFFMNLPITSQPISSSNKI